LSVLNCASPNVLQTYRPRISRLKCVFSVPSGVAIFHCPFVVLESQTPYTQPIPLAKISAFQGGGLATPAFFFLPTIGLLGMLIIEPGCNTSICAKNLFH